MGPADKEAGFLTITVLLVRVNAEEDTLTALKNWYYGEILGLEREV